MSQAQKNNPRLTVVVTRYQEIDKMVQECLESLAAQDTPITVLFLDQQDSDFARSLINNFKGSPVSFEYIVIPAKSLSYARNFGINNSKSRFVAYCDIDCILPPNWASAILAAFDHTHGAIIGTKIIPKWLGPTFWYHHSALLKEFYSLIDLSSEVTPIPKVVGASFALDLQLLGAEAYFDENLGRRPGKFLGGEETDLCQRAREKGLLVFYTPHTFAFHQVPQERLNLSWIQKRAYFGGLSRALRGGKSQPFNQKLSIFDYLALALIFPSYAAGYWAGKHQL